MRRGEAAGEATEAEPHEADPVVIWHNPGCGTSVRVLATLRAAGIEPTIVRYMQTGVTRAKLLRVLDALAMKPRDLLRPAARSALEEADEEAVLAALVADPSLMERPIVTTAKGAALCRPAERVRALL